MTFVIVFSALLVLAVVGVVAVLLWVGLRPVDAAELGRFSRRFAVEPTVDQRAEIAARLRLGRAARLGGAAIGVVVTAFVVASFRWLGAPSSGSVASMARPYVLPFTGLLAGGVAAEVVVAVRSSARVTGHPRARATAFVPAWPLRALDASTTVALGVAVAVVRLGAPAGVALASAGAAVVAWAVAQFGLAVVTAEPRRDSAVASDRVDAALRALGAQHIVGAAVAVSVLANQQLVLLLEGSSWWSDLALYGVIACGCSVWPHLARGRRWPMAGLADAAPRPDHPGPDGPDRRALPEQV